MDRVLSDLQPGLGTTAIVGELTLTKTGTTARTATFPDAAITVAGSATALTSGLIPQAGTGGILADSALATSGITGALTLTKTGTTARTVTFPDAAITVAGLGLAQTWTADQTFDVIKAQHCDAATSAGVHIGNASHQDVAIFGAGGGQGTTFYGQVNGTALVLSGAASCTALAVAVNTDSFPVALSIANASAGTSAGAGISFSTGDSSGYVGCFSGSYSAAYLADRAILGANAAAAAGAGVYIPSAGMSFDVIGTGGAVYARFDDNATAGNTRFLIYDVDNGTLERVTVGAADSGGTGYKLLRIPN